MGPLLLEASLEPFSAFGPNPSEAVSANWHECKKQIMLARLRERRENQDNFMKGWSPLLHRVFETKLDIVLRRQIKTVA
jgi:hypothetical protein